MLFINESQVAFLEDMMWERGYLDARQMAGAFQLLRSNDSSGRASCGISLGERSTRSTSWPGMPIPPGMPYRMHSEYLRVTLSEQ